jgi:hypothetical protein
LDYEYGLGHSEFLKGVSRRKGKTPGKFSIVALAENFGALLTLAI